MDSTPLVQTLDSIAVSEGSLGRLSSAPSRLRVGGEADNFERMFNEIIKEQVD